MLLEKVVLDLFMPRESSRTFAAPIYQQTGPHKTKVSFFSYQNFVFVVVDVVEVQGT